MIWIPIVVVLLFTLPPLLFYLISNPKALFDVLSLFSVFGVAVSVLVWFTRRLRGLPYLEEGVTVHTESLPTVPTETIDPNATYILTNDGEIVEVDENRIPRSAVSIQLNHPRDHQEH